MAMRTPQWCPCWSTSFLKLGKFEATYTHICTIFNIFSIDFSAVVRTLTTRHIAVRAQSGHREGSRRLCGPVRCLRELLLEIRLPED